MVLTLEQKIKRYLEKSILYSKNDEFVQCLKPIYFDFLTFFYSKHHKFITITYLDKLFNKYPFNMLMAHRTGKMHHFFNKYIREFFKSININFSKKCINKLNKLLNRTLHFITTKLTIEQLNHKQILDILKIK